MDTYYAHMNLPKPVVPALQSIELLEEIGRAAVWLASDFTDYIVGTTSMAE